MLPLNSCLMGKIEIIASILFFTWIGYWTYMHGGIPPRALCYIGMYIACFVGMR